MDSNIWNSNAVCSMFDVQYYYYSYPKFIIVYQLTHHKCLALKNNFKAEKKLIRSEYRLFIHVRPQAMNGWMVKFPFD